MKKHAIATIDSDVLLRLKLGDEKAFEVVYWKYSSWVFNFIQSLLYDKSLAEDLTQTVIARNLVYKETENRLQSEQVNIALKDRSIETESLMEENIDADSLKEYIDTLVEQLPPSRKDIFHLSRRHHLSNKEIAARLSISEKTVETQLYRALRFIKQKLSDDTNLAILMLLMIKGC